MIIPFSKGYRGPQAQPPDEAMMLMALAHMKQIGRIPSGKPIQVAGADQDKAEWFKAHPVPGGGESWKGLTDKQRQDLMWDTPVVKHADPELNADPKTNIQSIKEMLEDSGGRIRGFSDIPAFRDFEKSSPEGVDFHHLDDGTTIIHKPSAKAPLVS